MADPVFVGPRDGGDGRSRRVPAAPREGPEPPGAARGARGATGRRDRERRRSPNARSTPPAPAAPRHRRGRRSAGRARARVPRALATRGVTRSQPLADAGYRVLAPDQRGYGRSSRPDRGRGLRHPRADRRPARAARRRRRGAGRVRRPRLGRDRSCGSSRCSRPERVARRGRDERPVHAPRADAADRSSCARCSVTPSSTSSTSRSPGVADADLGRDPATTMRRLLAAVTREDGRRARPVRASWRPTGAGSSTASPSPTGCPTGSPRPSSTTTSPSSRAPASPAPINWYRNLDRNWELTAAPRRRRVEVPSLFIGGALDPVLLMSPPAAGEAFLDDHRGDRDRRRCGPLGAAGVAGAR